MRLCINNLAVLIPRARLSASGLAPLVCGLLAAIMVACGSGASDEANSPAAGKLPVVATTGILADIVRNVGGDDVDVRTLVPPGADVHSFQSTPGDSVAISTAKVVISNGLGLDDFLKPLINAAMASDAVHVVVSEELQLSQSSPVRGGEKIIVFGGHSSLDEDPHLWQNPMYVVHYVSRIRTALVKADPGRAKTFQDNAAEYIEKLRKLDLEIASTLGTVPPERRHLVTFHDAFGHFARRYGWRSLALAPHDGTPAKLVSVLEEIRTGGLPAVFVEPQFKAGVMAQAAADAGIEVAVFYSDTIDSTVPSYLEMMKFNVHSLVDHLR